uniref:Fatty acid desaturase domain-containing protein n=1 Tax=Stomoxys calcitrans TaxID=35570 RepID=A0A1I8NWE4_STOCA
MHSHVEQVSNQQEFDSVTGILNEEDLEVTETALEKDIRVLKSAKERKLEPAWLNIIIISYVALGSLYGLYLLLTNSVKLKTFVFATILSYSSGLAITAGAHRLWTHRSYKAKWPVKIFLLILNTVAYQNSVYVWARDHRVHHKYSETDADPHNAMRGFFFSHVGWLLCKKHPDVKAKGKGIDMSDLKSDPLVMFQHRHYFILMPLLSFVIPTLIPMYLWGETFSNSWHVSALLRWFYSVNWVWCINSVCHLYGNKPYDKRLNPGENNQISWLTLGECFHNYHHVFPWDYKTAELGGSMSNLGALFIETCAKFGLTYDLKTVPQDIIKQRIMRTGDGSHPIWGWGDKDQRPEEIANAVILEKRH